MSVDIDPIYICLLIYIYIYIYIYIDHCIVGYMICSTSVVR